MKIMYVTNKHPLSHNKKGSNQQYKDQFKNEFIKKYRNLYNNLPICGKTLKSAIYYIHRMRNGYTPPDVDNLSKPIVDSFNGVMYEDDSQIIYRIAAIRQVSDFSMISIDVSDVPYEIYQDFHKFCKSPKEDYIVLFGVEEIDEEAIKIGEF